MEGEGHYTFRKVPRPGRCPVRCCCRPSRAWKSKAPPGHRLCSTHQSRLWHKTHPIKAAFNKLRYHAKARGKVFTITLEQFKLVTGMQSYLDGKGKRRHCLHIDRVDPARGYEPDNIQVITNSENQMRNIEEMRRQLSGYTPPCEPPTSEENPF